MTIIVSALIFSLLLLSGTLGQDATLNTELVQPLRPQGCRMVYQPAGVTLSLSPAMHQHCRGRARRRQSRPRLSAAAAPSTAGIINPLLSSDALPNWDQIIGGASKSGSDPATYIVDAVMRLVGPAPASNGTAPGEEAASLQGMEQSFRSGAVPVSFSSVVLPLTQIRLRLDSVYQQIDQLMYLSSNIIGNAVDNTTPLRTAFQQRLLQSSDTFAALAAINRSGSLAKPEEQRLVKILLQDMQVAGAGQPRSRLARLNDIERRLADLSNRFMNNLQAAQESFRYWVRDPVQLDGLPQSVLDAALQNAIGEGVQANAKTGPWLLKFDGATADYVVAYASSRQLRQAVFNASSSLASQAGVDNSPVVKDILKLRQQKAALLSCKTFAQLQFARMMATFEQANTTMFNFATAAKRKAQAEVDLITQFAASKGAELPLQLWDLKYWRQRYKREVFKVDEAALRDYLLVDNVLDGMFKMANRLYGINLVRNRDATVWDEEVLAYNVTDAATNAVLGTIYFDLYTREGKDSGGYSLGIIDGAKFWRAANPAYVTSSRAAVRDPNTWLAAAPRQLPVATLALNQASPNKDGLAFMWLDDVGYLFHEFGHGLHHVLTNTPYGLASGWRNIEFDASETVSMMQEKWAWDKSTFLSFARHFKTGALLSGEVFDNIMQMRQFGQGIYLIEEIVKTVADLRLHSTYNLGGTETPDDLYDRTFRELMPSGLSTPSGKPLNSFDHIFGGFGYESAYYSYWWSDMMSADIYLKFQTDGGDAFGSNGRSFRNTFYALGGSLDPATLFRQFMGRGFSTDAAALIKYYNL